MIMRTSSSTDLEENLASEICQFFIRSLEIICFLSLFLPLPPLPSCLISLAKNSFSTSSRTPLRDNSRYLSSRSSSDCACEAQIVGCEVSTFSQCKALSFFFGRATPNEGATEPGIPGGSGNPGGRFPPGRGGGGGGGSPLAPGIGGGGGGGAPEPKPAIPGGGGGGGGALLEKPGIGGGTGAEPSVPK